MHDVSSMYVRIYRYILALFVSTINTTYGMHVRCNQYGQRYLQPYRFTDFRTGCQAITLTVLYWSQATSCCCLQEKDFCEIINWNGVRQRSAVPCRAVRVLYSTVDGTKCERTACYTACPSHHDVHFLSCFLHSRPNNTRLLKKVHTTELILVRKIPSCLSSVADKYRSFPRTPY